MKVANKKNDGLYKAVLQLKTMKECRNFFEDLCSIKELQDLSGRMEVAMLLSENLSYAEVSKRTGASTATICRVNKCLQYGSDGYKTVIARLKSGEEQS